MAKKKPGKKAAPKKASTRSRSARDDEVVAWSVRMPRELRDWLDATAEEMGLSRNQLLAFLVRGAKANFDAVEGGLFDDLMPTFETAIRKALEDADVGRKLQRRSTGL